MNRKRLDCEAFSIVIFWNVLQDKTINYLWNLLSFTHETPIEDVISDYGWFVQNLYEENVNLSEYILDKVLEDMNFYIIGKAQGKIFDSFVEEAVENELRIFQELSRITPDSIISEIDYDGFLPKWRTAEIDFAAEYKKRIENIRECGYGIYSKYHMFTVENGGIVPVKNPDGIRLGSLIGYELQRERVIENTLALLAGKPALNVLLRGDAGTGKSAAVKAVANEYRDRGLRIIEVKKEQLKSIPAIIERLSENPLKFILFIDDLSFDSGDESFGALKAILEGSVSGCSGNAVIYATSNRRHLVKESFSDRDGDDVHRNDTVQELISLSERFGITVTFSSPGRAEYLEIVKGLARQNGLEQTENLENQAERFAMEKGGRSPRAARQFIDSLRQRTV